MKIYKSLITVIFLGCLSCLVQAAEDSGVNTRVEQADQRCFASPGRSRVVTAEAFQRVEEQVKEIARLRVVLEDLKQRCDQAELARESQDDLIGTLRDQLSEMSAHEEKFELAIVELTEANRAQERTVLELRKNNTLLKDEEAHINGLLDEAKAALEEQKRLVLKEKEEARTLQQRMGEMEYENSDLGKIVEAQKKEGERVNALQSIVEGQAREIEELQGKLVRAGAVLQQAEARILELEQALRDQEDLQGRSRVAASADTTCEEEFLMDALSEHPSVQAQLECDISVRDKLSGLRGKIQGLLQISTQDDQELPRITQEIASLTTSKGAKAKILEQLQESNRNSSVAKMRGDRFSFVVEVAGPELAFAGAVLGVAKGIYDARRVQQKITTLEQEIRGLDGQLTKLNDQKRVCEDNQRLYAGIAALLT